MIRTKVGTYVKRTTDEFIAIAKKVHKDRYDYSLVKYTGALEKVEIICKEHGSFWQQANTHIRGQNCPVCAGRFLDRDIFIERANKVHNNTYKYDKAIYTGANNKLTITCELHGDFMQAPSDHLKGRGCPKCALQRVAENSKLTERQFLEKAHILYGDKYDYSEMEYKGYREDVSIICKIHGVFTKKPSTFLKGHGCRDCSKSSGFNKTRFVKLVSRYGCGYLYLVRLSNTDESFLKIGITCRQIDKRMACLPFDKEILHVETFDDGGVLFDAENKLQNVFKQNRYKPKTGFAGETECYSDVDIKLFHEIISKIKEGKPNEV